MWKAGLWTLRSSFLGSTTCKQPARYGMAYGWELSTGMPHMQGFVIFPPRQPRVCCATICLQCCEALMGDLQLPRDLLLHA